MKQFLVWLMTVALVWTSFVWAVDGRVPGGASWGGYTPVDLPTPPGSSWGWSTQSTGSVNKRVIGNNPFGFGWGVGSLIKSKEDVYVWKVGVQSPRDAASGLPTGKRQHKPITVVCDDEECVDLSSIGSFFDIFTELSKVGNVDQGTGVTWAIADSFFDVFTEPVYKAPESGFFDIFTEISDNNLTEETWPCKPPYLCLEVMLDSWGWWDSITKGLVDDSDISQELSARDRNPNSVKCACGTDVRGKDQAACDRICDFLKNNNAQKTAPSNTETSLSPRDAASGLPTGKRQHKPIVIRFAPLEVWDCDNTISVCLPYRIILEADLDGDGLSEAVSLNWLPPGDPVLSKEKSWSGKNSNSWEWKKEYVGHVTLLK